jgi:hypothetical protein
MKKFPKITIKVIPHKKQRYPKISVGDYYKKGDKWIICTSKLGDTRYEFLVLLHEFIEWYLTQHRKIREPKIMKWDIEFEKKRKKGDKIEPGDSKNAPYGKEHRVATKVEKLLAKELKVNWKKYYEKMLKLFP